MKIHRWISVAMLCAIAACSDTTPAKKRNVPVKSSQYIEQTLRSIIADQMKVGPDTVDMKKPLAGPPLKADEFEIVEMVTRLEDQIGVQFPKSVFEKHGGLASKNGPMNITPAELVAIAKNAVDNSFPKKAR